MIPNYQFQLEIENGWIRRAKSEVWIGVDVKLKVDMTNWQVMIRFK
jgi:hypothetical protein